MPVWRDSDWRANAFHEVVHATDRLQERGLPLDVAVAKNEIVPEIGTQDVVKRERIERHQRPIADAARALEAARPVWLV